METVLTRLQRLYNGAFLTRDLANGAQHGRTLKDTQFACIMNLFNTEPLRMIRILCQRIKRVKVHVELRIIGWVIS